MQQPKGGAAPLTPPSSPPTHGHDIQVIWRDHTPGVERPWCAPDDAGDARGHLRNSVELPEIPVCVTAHARERASPWYPREIPCANPVMPVSRAVPVKPVVLRTDLAMYINKSLNCFLVEG